MSIAIVEACLFLFQGIAGSQPGQTPRVRPAQQQAQSPRPELKAEEYSKFEGVVVDANTQAPLNKVRLVLVNTGDRGNGSGLTATSDASGRFVFDRVAPGRYNLSAQRNGYSRPGVRRGDSYTLATGLHLKGVVVKLAPAAVITGRVVDEDGDAVPYARVMVMQYRRIGGRRELAPSGGGGTNDLGEFRIFGIPPGRYYVSATFDEDVMPGRMMRRRGRAQGAETGYATQYYPGVFDPSQTTPLQLRAGEERSGIDFRLARVSTVRVSGRVVSGITGKPLAEVAVGLTPNHDDRLSIFGNHYTSADSETGEFSIGGVRPGAYVLTSRYGERETEVLFARMDVDVGQNDINGLQVQLTRGTTLAGRVSVEGNRASEKELASVRLFLQPKRAGNRGNQARVETDGSFEFRNLAPDEYILRTMGLPEGWYAKAVRLGNQDVLLPGFSVGPAADGQILGVTLSPTAGRLEGIVLDRDKKPFLGATVVLVPEEAKRSREDFFKSANTDQNGYFQFGGVAPGEYKLFAWDKVEPGAYFDPSFLEPYENDGAKVTVKESSQQSKELELIVVEEPEG